MTVEQSAFELLAIAAKLLLAITRSVSKKTFIIEGHCPKNLLLPMKPKFEIDLPLISTALDILIVSFVAVIFSIPPRRILILRKREVETR